MEDDRKLRSMGVAWFISYSYFINIDSNHKNWSEAGTLKLRKSWFSSSINNHKKWIEDIYYNKNEKLLGKNSIGLTGTNIKNMAMKLLQLDKLKFYIDYI